MPKTNMIHSSVSTELYNVICLADANVR